MAATAARRRHLLPPRCSPRSSTCTSSKRPAHIPIDRHHALMLEYAGSQRAGLQRHREGVALGNVLRSLDWLLLAGVAGLVVVGLWAISGVTQFDVPGAPQHYLQRQIVYAAVGGVALLVGVVVDPDLY